MGYALKRLGVTYKKTLKHPKSCTDKRRIYQEKIQAHKTAGRSIVFSDESGFAHDMPRTHEYALKGKRCYGRCDWCAKGRTNVIGALLGRTLLTVTLLNGNINTEVFVAWVEQDLIPKLPPESVLVIDNATFHKAPRIRQLLEASGHVLEYLPPYSPDLNPIEKKWAQAKKLRRKTQASIEDLFRDNLLL